MKIINRADRLVGDCPVVDPLTFLAGCQQQDTWLSKQTRCCPDLVKLQLASQAGGCSKWKSITDSR